ncbi:MAG: hypothetical protein RJB66_1810 [Pseudomonadota bacterium]|jgi:tRNA(adenine34) deaminase
MSLRLRASTIVVHEGKLLTFLAVDPHDGREFYFLPGGKIEGGETAPEAAIRETLEETGYTIEVDTSSCVDYEYEFFWNGSNHHCLTVFYRGTIIDPMAEPQAVAECDYHKAVVWLPLKDVRSKINYSGPILEAIFQLL